MRLTLCEAPTRETRPDHNTGNFVPYSLREVRRFFKRPLLHVTPAKLIKGDHFMSIVCHIKDSSNQTASFLRSKTFYPRDAYERGTLLRVFITAKSATTVRSLPKGVARGVLGCP